MVHRVLLLDDTILFAELVSDLFRGRCVIVWTTVPDEAEHIVRNDPKLSAVVVDGKLGQGTTEESESFVRTIRPIYGGPIVACSAHPDYAERLMTAGCTHQVAFKHELGDLLQRLLGLPSEPP